MTDKVQKILSEIATRKLCTMDEHMAFYNDKAKEDYRFLSEIEELINTLQKEPVCKDFEVALEKKVREAQDWTYIEEEGGECPLNEEFGADDLEEFARWGAEWQKQQILDCNTTLQRTFELGKQEMKQQMMANAVDVTVHIDNGNYPYIPQMELYDYDKDIPLAREGDKYKVILIKED